MKTRSSFEDEIAKKKKKLNGFSNELEHGTTILTIKSRLRQMKLIE